MSKGEAEEASKLFDFADWTCPDPEVDFSPELKEKIHTVIAGIRKKGSANKPMNVSKTVPFKKSKISQNLCNLR